MSEIIKCRKPSLEEKAEGKTLCRSGFHNSAGSRMGRALKRARKASHRGEAGIAKGPVNRLTRWASLPGMASSGLSCEAGGAARKWRVNGGKSWPKGDSTWSRESRSRGGAV